jgi:hypothetical protein
MRISLVWERYKRSFRKVELKKEVIASFCKVRFSKQCWEVLTFWNLEPAAKGRVYEYF